MIRPVLHLPHPVLSRVAAPIGEVGDDARRLAGDLVDTMRGTGHSVGVAAPQIGVSARALCVDVTGHRKARSCHGEVVLFDPVVVSSGAPEVGREGCMSVPELTGDVARAREIVVHGTGLDGRPVTIAADAFEARALQHELDHLDGLLFLDRLVSEDRFFPRRVRR